MLLENLEIIVGTYEEFLLGYRPKNVNEVISLNQTFASHGHKASVRCVTSEKGIVASGGADDCVHLYDLLRRKETFVLMHHNGTVSCVEFTPNGSHLLTGGEDGLLAILKIGNFQVEKTWNSAHKGSAILGISVHPTGKLALTVGADATLSTWNLVKGRKAYTTRLGSSKCGAGWQISGVCWSTTGKFYVLGIGSKLDVYSVQSAAIVYSLTIDSKICSFCFLNDYTLCIGSESGVISIHNVRKKCCITEEKVHEQRVKCLRCVIDEEHKYLVSASSTGQIKLWEYKNKALHELSKVTTGCRITSLTIATCGYPNVKEEEEEEELVEETFHVAPVYVARRGVVIVEEENFPEKRKNRKKRKVKHTAFSNFAEVDEEADECKEPIKKQKTNCSKMLESGKIKTKSSKKGKSSLMNSWNVSDRVT